jgi:chromosome segregation ATPase
MMGLFVTTLVYVFDETDNEPVAGDVQDVQGVQDDEALESEEPVEQEEAEEPVDKNVLVDKLADAEKNKKAMDESLSYFKKAFDKSVADYMKLQKDSTACCNNIAKFEDEKTKLAEKDAELTEALYKMKIERIVKNVEVIFDSKKDNNAFKSALKKDNENIAKKEKELAINKKNLDAKNKALADEKAKYEALLPTIENALFVKDSLNYEVQGCELKAQILYLEIENLILNIALGEEKADNAAIEEKLADTESAIEEANAEYDEVQAAFTALKNEKYPPVVEEVPEEVEVVESGIGGIHKSLKIQYIGVSPRYGTRTRGRW